MRSLSVFVLALGLGTVLGTTTTLYAQQQGIKRTPLQKVVLTDVSGKEAVMGIAEIPPGVAAGRHTHPGFEIGYVLDGVGVLEIEGEQPVTIKAGDSYAIPAGKAHDAKSVGTVPARVLAVYIVDTGKPLASPAP